MATCDRIKQLFNGKEIGPGAGVLLLFSLSAAAQGSPLFGLSASSAATACVMGTAASASTGCSHAVSVPGVNLASASADAVGGAADVVVNAHAFAAFGDLGGEIDTLREDLNVYVDGVDLLQDLGEMSAQFTDSITVNGTGMIEILPSLVIHSALAGYVDGVETAILAASFKVGGQTLVSGTPIFLAPGTYGVIGIFSAQLFSTNSYPVLNPGGPPYAAIEFTELNVSGSADFNLDVLSGGGSLQSASGHDYSSSAVPEPMSGFMIGLGLIVISFIRKSGTTRAPG
jgi:hypothetical protein